MKNLELKKYIKEHLRKHINESQLNEIQNCSDIGLSDCASGAGCQDQKCSCRAGFRTIGHGEWQCPGCDCGNVGGGDKMADTPLGLDNPSDFEPKDPKISKSPFEPSRN